MSDLKAKLEQIQVSLATKGKLDEFLAPRLWEALRVNLQSLYRQATGETMAVLVVEADTIASKNREIAEKEEARAEQWRLRRDADASRDAARAAADSMRMERDSILTALRSIAAPSDCGCSPACQCNSQESLSIEIEELRETALAAIRSLGKEGSGE